MVTPMHAQSFPCSAKYQPASINRSSQGAVPTVAGRVGHDNTVSEMGHVLRCCGRVHANCTSASLVRDQIGSDRHLLQGGDQASAWLRWVADHARPRADPEGVIGVKPKPMPGWSIEIKRGAYERSYKFYHGAVLTEGVKEIVWSGKLRDEFYDEFVFAAFLTDSLAAGTTLHFPVYQDCEKGAHAWADVPAPGQDAHGLKSPAPGIALLPVADKGQAAQTSR